MDFNNDRISKYILSYIPDNSTNRPKYGKIFTHINHPIFSSARTEIVEYCDALITIGGGEGTVDSIDKAKGFLQNFGI